MDDDIETSQSSQESDSDVDIGMKASTYTTVKCNIETIVYSWPNIEKQLASLYIRLVQELATTCIRYYWNNVDVLIVACAIAESYAIVKDNERQCPKPLKILNIRPDNQTSAERSLLVLGTWVSVLSPN
jgi:hypothetical protein